MRVFGPRNIVEAAFLVAVPIVALAAGLTAWPIIGASAAAYLLVAAVEATIARLGGAVEAQPQRPTAQAWTAPTPAPPPVVLPEREPEPVAATSERRGAHVRVLRAAPRSPDPAPPAWSNVVPIGVPGPPRRWSIWDLERVAKEHAGSDVAADEERSFLLLYLREFADSDGLLPTDFDALVRGSFGSLVAQ
ncbi:MAG TPA: hypothetical protein VKP14_04345 [Gaiellaceae bacterium]|nr:hypothetical protein [Gaiellaceae bacterium]